MGRQLDRDLAREVLEQEYELAEQSFRDGTTIEVPERIAKSTERMFLSKTQAYRETLVGCALARILDPEIDIRSPYAGHGENAFSARDLDEQVVNPFLRDRAIPSSRGPYLAVFRRSPRFVSATAQGLRDKAGYAAFLDLITQLESTDEKTARLYLRYVLFAFVALRDAADIPLAKVQRLSVEQYEALIDGLLSVPSGGRMPVLLAVATFKTLNECFELDWTIEWQGINVADRASGVGGDISVSRDDDLLFSVEVTERPLDRARVVSTFSSKIAPGGIDDYIFFFTATQPSEEARAAARQYFAQGHDINFVQITVWIMTILRTIGTECRKTFTETFTNLLADPDVPAALKVAWNDHIQRLLAV